VKKASGFYPSVRVDSAPVAAVGSAGGVLLTKTAELTGVSAAMREALSAWRKPTAVHDRGKVLTDVAVALALGGDCLADAAIIRAEEGLFGAVASDATVSRTISALAKDAERVLAAVAAARKAARAQAWAMAGDDAPNHAVSVDDPLIVDLDATLVTAHSEKEQAAPTFKRGYGFHPLCAFLDHGPDGTGEALALRLRPGNAGSNTAADHIAITRDALAALPSISASRPGRKVLIRADGGGGTKEFLGWLTRRGVSYSIGFTLPDRMPMLYQGVPEQAWQAAVDADGDVRDGAGVVDLTGVLRFQGHLDGWPAGMRVIVRRERPHPGAQLRFDDVDGYRLTAFATNAVRGQLAVLELRHRRRRPMRGPNPDRQRHRAAEPAPARIRPEPDLVRAGHARHRPNRLDPAARDRSRAFRPTMGTQADSAAPVHDPGHPRPARTPSPAARQGHRTLGRPRRQRPPPPQPAHQARWINLTRARS